MCRLVAHVGTPAPLGPLVYGGEHTLLRQSWAPKELLSGSVNADGWGVAWHADGVWRRLAEARPLWFEQDLEGTLGGLASGCAVAALRNGTPGIAVERSALLPMVREGWCFVLNGFVPDFRKSHMRALRAGLTDASYGTLEGVSDSETLFLMALDRLRLGATPWEALKAVEREIYARVGERECQLTMTLTDGARFAAVRGSNVPAANSLYAATGHPLAPGGTLLASERLDGSPRWERVPAHVGLAVTAEGVTTVSG